MVRTTQVVFVGLIIAVLGAVVSAEQAPVRIAGTIEAVDGGTLRIRIRQSDDARVELTSDVKVFGVERRTLADIKPGDFVGVGAVPLQDGSQKALRVQIFPPGESPNPGFRSWNGAAQGTMTNAHVGTIVVGVEDRILMLKYQDGEKKIIITPETQIVGTVRGDKKELKVGAAVVIARATPKNERHIRGRPHQRWARRSRSAVTRWSSSRPRPAQRSVS